MFHVVFVQIFLLKVSNLIQAEHSNTSQLYDDCRMVFDRRNRSQIKNLYVSILPFTLSTIIHFFLQKHLFNRKCFHSHCYALHDRCTEYFTTILDKTSLFLNVSIISLKNVSLQFCYASLKYERR